MTHPITSLLFVCVQSAALDRALSDFRCICGDDAVSLAEAVREQHGRDESVHRSFTRVILHHLSCLTKHKTNQPDVGTVNWKFYKLSHCSLWLRCLNVQVKCKCEHVNMLLLTSSPISCCGTVCLLFLYYICCLMLIFIMDYSILTFNWFVPP